MIVKNGYISLQVLNPEDLNKWVSSVFGKYNMDKSQLVDPKDYHLTLQYSQTPIEGYVVSNYVYEIDSRDMLVNNQIKLELFDSKVDPEFKHALVLKVDDWRLKARNSYGKHVGATSNYPEYKPHITLAYLRQDVDDKNILRERPTGFSIKLGNEIVKDLDTEFKPMNNK